MVVAIIGLLLSIISISLSNARMKSRDTRRVSDLKQIKTGLDLYYNHGGGYPDDTAWITGTELICSGVTIMRIPRDPGPSGFDYVYTARGNSSTGCGGTVRSQYELRFYMENKGAYYTMDEEGGIRDTSGNSVSVDSLL